MSPSPPATPTPTPGAGWPPALAWSVTPFDEGGLLDEAALRAHLRRLAGAGVGVVVGAPTAGEGDALAEGEAARLFAVAVDEVGGTVPVWASTPDARSAAQAVAVARAAEAAGVDAVVVQPLDIGRGDKPTGSVASSGYVGGVIGSPGASPTAGTQLDRYERAVLAGTDLPVVVAATQASGYVIQVELLAALAADHDRLAGFVVGVGSARYLMQVVDEHPGTPTYVDGCLNALDLGALGGTGGVDHLANLVPEACRRLYELLAAGRAGEAAEVWQGLLQLHLALTCGPDGAPARTVPAATKAALALMGTPVGAPRDPYAPLAPDDERALAEALAPALDRLSTLP